MEIFWFESWTGILRIICVAPVAYMAMVLLLRVSGKRTLSKMNAFDFVVTIALGSILASVALMQNIPLANGVVAILSFIVFQFLFTWLSVRVKAVKNLITSSPTMIFYKGDFLYPVMKKERITVEEIYSAARQKGLSALDGIDMIILETTGDISIIETIVHSKETTYYDVIMEPQ